MITEEQIAKINEYAHRVKAGEELTEEELKDRDHLRRLYIDSVVGNLRGHLENIEK